MSVLKSSTFLEKILPQTLYSYPTGSRVISASSRPVFVSDSQSKDQPRRPQAFSAAACTRLQQLKMFL